MFGRVRSTYIPCLATMLVFSFVGIHSNASQPVPEINTASMIHVTSRCISTMKAYRQAIAFLDKRLKKSPPAVTFEMKNGDSITLLNRTHWIMSLEKRVLISGYAARHQACLIALKG
ncbi:MAG: hypothetical protein HWE25_14245 [Alphaproteobacteria bacterium]|nr:hypothetical protein [Alphaproteobacteria bacterium]